MIKKMDMMVMEWIQSHNMFSGTRFSWHDVLGWVPRVGLYRSSPINHPFGVWGLLLQEMEWVVRFNGGVPRLHSFESFIVYKLNVQNCCSRINSESLSGKEVRGNGVN